MKIQVDVDATLYDAHSLFLKVAEKEFDVNLPQFPFNWHDYAEKADFQTLLKIFKRAHSAKHVSRQIPYPGAKEVVRNLADKGHVIYYVSDRHPDTRENLIDWLDGNGFPLPDEDILKWHVITGQDKREWMRTKKCEIVIDDRVRTMLLAYSYGARVFSLKHTWNLNLCNEIEGITLFDNWNELGQELEKVT